MNNDIAKSKVIAVWLFALLLSAIAIAAIGYKWYQVQRIYGEDTVIIKNKADLDSVLKAKDTAEFQGDEKPFYIPTGFFIHSLAFITPSDVNITGYIWQKYPEDFPGDVEKGFIFPEEVSSENTVLIERYKSKGMHNDKSYNMIGHYFDVTLRQTFDYSNYPLDFLTVWMRIWSKDIMYGTRVILVPDFDAYAQTGKDIFGVDLDIVGGEWEIDETFFSYKNIPYDTDFGFFTDTEEATYKEFFVNLGIRRKFINGFVINLVPLLVVALLLSAQIMTVSGHRERAKNFGFTANGAIATCSALFFVVLLAHVQVRGQFAGSGLVYLEYFYLIMYVMILLTSLNAYIFSIGKLKHFNLIQYRDNFIPKVAFWPAMLWAMAVVTWLELG